MRFWEPRKCINDKIKSYYASNPLKILAALKFCRIVQYLPLICKRMFQIGMKRKKINHGSLEICFFSFPPLLQDVRSVKFDVNVNKNY